MKAVLTRTSDDNLKIIEINSIEDLIDLHKKENHINNRFGLLKFEEVTQHSLKYIKAPLWQQTFDWFEDRYNLYVTIHGEALNGHRIGFYYSITEEGWVNFYESVDDDLIFDTKEEARQACLGKLIELCKNN